ncbi:MAG: hypothetical protein V8R55_01860 [Dysosmobacter sp.]
MKRCFIFAAGTFYGLRRKPEEPEDLVIAADAGYRTCRELGIVPDLLLGDFDSMEQPEDFANIHRSPVEKDDTDTMLAVKTGLEQGCESFTSTAALADGGWTILWPISKRCCTCGGGAPGAISTTMILSGRLLKMRPSGWTKPWSGASCPYFAWETGPGA